MMNKLLEKLLSSSAPRLSVDSEGVTLRSARGTESIAWADLSEVGILTTDAGPFFSDFFWILIAQDGSKCCVSSELEGADRLLERLQALPGFDNEAVIAASGCTSNASFQCWQKAV